MGVWSGDAERLYVDLAAGAGLRLICRPLLPAREGSPDERLLGLPLHAIELYVSG